MSCFDNGAAPLQKRKNPQPPKVLGRVLREVLARIRVLGEVLGKVLVLLVPGRDTRRTSTFPSPVSGRHLSEHSPEHFWGVGGVALLYWKKGERPPPPRQDSAH